jgi:hypothetical protein
MNIWLSVLSTYYTGFMLVLFFGLYWATFTEYGLSGEGKTSKDFWRLMWAALLWAVIWPYGAYLLIYGWWKNES